MFRYLLPPTTFRKDDAMILTCGYYDEDRPSANYLSEDIIHEIDNLELDKDLSFIFVQYPSFELVGFILVKIEDYDDRPKGVKIHSIGYTDDEVFSFIISQLKLNLRVENYMNDENKYNYIWGYECENYTFLSDDFLIDYRKNIFIADLSSL